MGKSCTKGSKSYFIHSRLIHFRTWFLAHCSHHILCVTSGSWLYTPDKHNFREKRTKTKTGKDQFYLKTGSPLHTWCILWLLSQSRCFWDRLGRWTSPVCRWRCPACTESILMCTPPLCGNENQSMGGRTRQQQADLHLLAASTRSERSSNSEPGSFIPFIQQQGSIYCVQKTGIDTILSILSRADS